MVPCPCPWGIKAWDGREWGVILPTAQVCAAAVKVPAPLFIHHLALCALPRCACCATQVGRWSKGKTAGATHAQLAICAATISAPAPCHAVPAVAPQVGRWSEEETNTLIQLIIEYGEGNWAAMHADSRAALRLSLRSQVSSAVRPPAWAGASFKGLVCSTRCTARCGLLCLPSRDQVCAGVWSGLVAEVA